MANKQQHPVQQTAIGDGNVQFAGDNNTVNVNQTFIQRVINNIFKSDTESTEQRNRRIMLNHVENFWVKGILEKSLHGAALLELGIKEDPDALTYPWAIKQESTKETLPAGMSMLVIFEQIGMGRSLLILGAPGSGKTTMLLELTRQLIERAREDVTEPIPVVFNLSSWTEKYSLADWLARELNTIYTIPKKVAPTWVKENKMLLLLDGLDEVRQENRDKCVDAINEFRKENGLTSMTVCSRIQNYVGLKSRLSFDGAIEIQPLTHEQVDEYFNHLGKEMSGVRQVLVKDSALREMAENPLFLSIITLTYQTEDAAKIVVLENVDKQRKYLFNTYVERMFEHSGANTAPFEKQDVLQWLVWLARKMIDNKAIPYLYENMQPTWLSEKTQVRRYRFVYILLVGIFVGIITGSILNISMGLAFGLSFALGIGVSIVQSQTTSTAKSDFRIWEYAEKILQVGLMVGLIIVIIFGISRGLMAWVRFDEKWSINGLIFYLQAGIHDWFFLGFLGGLIAGLVGWFNGFNQKEISTVDSVAWEWKKAQKNFSLGLNGGMVLGLIIGLIVGLDYGQKYEVYVGWNYGVVYMLGTGLSTMLMVLLISGLNMRQVDQTTYPGQRLVSTSKNFIFTLLFFGLGSWLVSGMLFWLLSSGLMGYGLQIGPALYIAIELSEASGLGLFIGLIAGLISGLTYGGVTLVQHYTLRFFLVRNKLLPWRLIPFLDHCVDLIFLRRVGGGYIFVHRLLMEHFADMYTADEK